MGFVISKYTFYKDFDALLEKSIYVPTTDPIMRNPNGITFFNNTSMLSQNQTSKMTKDQSFYKKAS